MYVHTFTALQSIKHICKKKIIPFFKHDDLWLRFSSEKVDWFENRWRWWRDSSDVLSWPLVTSAVSSSSAVTCRDDTQQLRAAWDTSSVIMLTRSISRNFLFLFYYHRRFVSAWKSFPVLAASQQPTWLQRSRKSNFPALVVVWVWKFFHKIHHSRIIDIYSLWIEHIYLLQPVGILWAKWH